MASFNWSSIEAKAKAYLNTAEGKQRGASAKSVVAINNGVPEEAAKMFIDVLQKQIRSLEATDRFWDGNLGHTAVAALVDLSYTKPEQGALKGQCVIGINFGDDESKKRKSLDPRRHPEGLNNIVALLNNGFQTRDNKQAFGVWEGHGDRVIRGMNFRLGAHFIEDAIRIFMETYAAKYGVTHIEVADVYGVRT